MSTDRFEEEANSILHAVLYRERRGYSDVAKPIQDGLEEAHQNGKESSVPSPAAKQLVRICREMVKALSDEERWVNADTYQQWFGRTFIERFKSALVAVEDDGF